MKPKYTIHKRKDNIYEILLPNLDNAYLRMQKLEDGTYCVITTFVDPAHRDNGVGHKLYEALIDFIRTEETKFKTTCPYISQVISEDKNNKDIYIS